MSTDMFGSKRRHRWVTRNRHVTLVALLSVAAILATGATQPAEAAFPGENGQIAYANRDGWIRTDEGIIFEAPIEGTVSRDPAWSPDGTRLVFSSTLHIGGFDEAELELYVINADGTGLARLTTNNDPDYEPAWSPSGTEIAFVRRNPLTGNPSIRRMEVIPGARSSLLVSGAETPAWSPDGSSLAYTRGSGIGDAFSLDVYTTTGGRLTACSDNRSPTWSPDGNEIAFERSGEIWRMNSNGTDRRVVIQEPFPLSNPAWSPDGHDIAARWFFSGRIGVYDAGGGFRLRDFGNGPGRIDWQPLANTQPGPTVTVSPVDPNTGTAPVTLTFASVTSAGQTTLTISDTGPPPPAGFSLGDPPTYRANDHGDVRRHDPDLHQLCRADVRRRPAALPPRSRRLGRPDDVVRSCRADRVWRDHLPVPVRLVRA